MRHGQGTRKRGADRAAGRRRHRVVMIFRDERPEDAAEVRLVLERTFGQARRGESCGPSAEGWGSERLGCGRERSR